MCSSDLTRPLADSGTKITKMVCVSANPALDRRIRLKTLELGEVNRASGVETFGGGKSAHVAMAGQALGIHPIWLGFLGGTSGEECASKLRRLSLEVVAVPSDSPTRLKLELLHDGTRITEILEPGGAPGAAALDEMPRQLEAALRNHWQGALVSLSGSLPAGTPAEFYASLIRIARSADASTFLDTSGEALARGLSAQPTLVKVNRHEAHELVQRALDSPSDAARAAREMIQRGAQSAAITLGSDGLVWLEKKEGPALLAKPPRLEAISTVGCGDTTLAGFAVAFGRGLKGAEAARFAAACGAANCLAPIPGAIQQKDVDALLPQVEITTLD